MFLHFFLRLLISVDKSKISFPQIVKVVVELDQSSSFIRYLFMVGWRNVVSHDDLDNA